MRRTVATSFQSALENLRTTRVWRSIFRRGPAITNRTRSVAVFGNLFLHWLPVKVREKSLRVRAAYYLGSLSLLLFIILVVTGVLLMFYYHPAAPKAYHDMKDLRFVVSNGVFLRNMHRVGAHLMVLLVFWHMFHVFYRGGYKPPHEFNWVVGVILLLITLFLSYTGYLLPWDQLAFWAVTVGENALLRFYVLHVVILPLLAFLFIGVHFWRVQKDGGLTVGSKDDDGKN
jgi:quinol-cytochrome oxidoreductase complex cytochrome b subunit